MPRLDIDRSAGPFARLKQLIGLMPAWNSNPAMFDTEEWRSDHIDYFLTWQETSPGRIRAALFESRPMADDEYALAPFVGYRPSPITSASRLLAEYRADLEASPPPGIDSSLDELRLEGRNYRHHRNQVNQYVRSAHVLLRLAIGEKLLSRWARRGFALGLLVGIGIGFWIGAA